MSSRYSNSGAAIASCSARSISASSAAAVPCRRNFAIRARSLSRITVLPGIQCEEVAGHLFEDQRLEAAEIEQAVLQRLFDGGEERTAGVVPFQPDQTAQPPPAPPVAVLLKSGNVSVETGVMAAQQG